MKPKICKDCVYYEANKIQAGPRLYSACIRTGEPKNAMEERATGDCGAAAQYWAEKK